MIELLNQLQPWHWYVLAVILLVLEVSAPGAFFLWIGIAAASVGVLLWLVPISWESQLTVFAFLSIVDIVAWRFYRSRVPAKASDSPMLNRRMERYVGTVLTLDTPIVNGTGQVRMKDTLWSVRGPDTAAGKKVKVIGYDGPNLIVEPADSE